MEHHHPTKTKYCLIFYLIISISSFLSVVLAREIRPTEHGLGFQNNAVEDKDSPEMRSFFGTKTAASLDPLPTHGGDSHGEGWERGSSALFVATFLCGAAGAGMLIAAGLIFLFKNRWTGPPSLEQQNKSCN